MTRLLVAEDVTRGHPDRLADALAETVVDRVVAADPSASAGVEVALHRHRVLLTGHLALGEAGAAEVLPADRSPIALDDWVAGLAAEVLAAAGYSGAWDLPVHATADLDIEETGPADQAGQGFSCDQDVVVGYATPDADLGHLPLETVAARAAVAALGRLVLDRPEVLGPDAKVLVVLRPDGPSAVLEALNLSVLHHPEVGYVDLYRTVVPDVAAALAEVPGVRVPDRVDAGWCTVNGAGPFVLAGPMGDGGLSGKKLVADLYGPGVPIGGGALCGKDAYKTDRCGPLRARQVAVRLARATGEPATVWAGWFPGGTTPQFLWARLGDGRELDAAAVDRLVGLPDLSIRGTVEDLGLTSQRWVDLVGRGYVGGDHPWDRDVAVVDPPPADQTRPEPTGRLDGRSHEEVVGADERCR